MRGWKLVVLLCTTLYYEPVRPQEKWSKPETAEKRIDDWVPITASCPSCQKNLEPNDAGADEIGSLLNPPAAPSGRAFNFNPKNNNFIRSTAGEPYEVTTPAATSAQFFQQQQPPKIPQPVHFPVPFFGQQNPFQTRFQTLPGFQPQFTFVPQQQIQPAPKQNKIAFPESPFIQQQNKGSVQLVYVPIEALQRQKPRLQADRPTQQQTKLDIKSQSPFETGKLKFQRPPNPFDPSRFPSSQQFEPESNRFTPPPPPTSSFEQDVSRFPPPSQLFEQQQKPAFSTQLNEQRPEFMPQNEQQVAPQSYQFVEDARNPPSNFFMFHDNRFQKPSFTEEKPKEIKQQSFSPNFDESRQESAQNVVSSFDGNRPLQGPPQNFQSTFQDTRPRPEQQSQQNFQETRPRPEQQPPQNFQETIPRQEQAPQHFQQNFQDTRPRPEQPPLSFQQNFQETRPKQEPQLQNFQETRPRQETPLPQFIQKFEEPKLEPQQQFIPNFQETRPRQELPALQQFIPKFEEPKLEPQQQFVPNFQETRPRQESSPVPQFVPKFEEPKLEPQPQFIPKFEEPKLESQPQFVSNFQEIPQQEVAQQTFTPNIESLRPTAQLSPALISSPQQTFNVPSSTEQTVKTPSTTYPPPHQPPLSVYMEKRLDNRINEVLTILKDAKTIPVLDTIGNRSPKVFVGPSDLDAPRGYLKFELPYLSSLDITKIDSMADRLPFFVAPLNFKPPFGYAKIPFPPPHIGSVVVSSKTPAVVSSTEFTPFTLTSQLPTEVNSLQPTVSSTTTQRVTEQAQQDVTTSTPKRGRQRKPLHRGSLTSFSSTTPVSDVTERQRDQFTTPAELQRLPESSPSVSDHQQSLESTTTPVRQKYSRKPVEQQTIFENTQAPVQQQQQFVESTPTPVRPKFLRKPIEHQTGFENTIAPVQQQQQFVESTPTPVRPKFLRKPIDHQTGFDNTLAPVQEQQQQFVDSTPTPVRPKLLRKPVEQQTVFETTPTPTQQQQFENSQQQQFDNSPQQQFDNSPQQQFDSSPQQQFFADQHVPQNQQEYLDTLPQLTQQQQPSQQPFFDNQQQFLDNSPQVVQEQNSNNPQSTNINNQETNQQQFISSATEKQIFKNFQQIQPLSQYQVGNNFLNQQQQQQQQPSSTEHIQPSSNPPQTVSNEPQTEATLAPTDTPKLRQRLSYYDKLMQTSTNAPAESTSAQNAIESGEKPRERPKLRPRQRLTTTRKPTTESQPSEEVPAEHVSETSTQRYNPLKRRRPTTTTSTTTTTEQTEVTRNPLRSRTTQAGSRSEFVRSRSRRPTTTTSTTTTTTTTESAPVRQYEDANDVRVRGQDEQKKIEEAASFWNEPVTIQQSHSYELDTRYTESPSSGNQYGGGEPPAAAAEDFPKDSNKYGHEKKAHDPNGEKKTPGRRGHWVRVRVKKPQDGLDTAESQNSLGPHSANAVRESVTKPTTEFGGPSSTPEPATTPEPQTEPVPETTTPVPTTTSTTTATPTTAVPSTTTTTTTTTSTTTASPTTVFDFTEGMTDDENPAETTAMPPSTAAVAKYPDDEQDEVFQRNLADMLAKFIGNGGNEPQHQQHHHQQHRHHENHQRQHQQQPEQQEQEQQEPTETAFEESTAETQYVGSDAELTVTEPAVTETPAAPVTSTTTKVSMETEICYRGRCVKSKKNKQITDLVSEP